MMRARNVARPMPFAAIGILTLCSPLWAQDVVELEGIVISAPSPVVSAAGVRDVDPSPGSLIVVDGALVPVTVVTDRDILAESGGSIADALDKRPGIVASTFAPGSSRPIIRGLDAYRVKVLENGIGSNDVSELSEDHAVPIDPFAAQQIEVIRGPATLRYGSQAIGGVVAVETGRIPTFVPKGGFTAEMKGDATSADEGRNGAFRATAGASGVVVHADGFRRRTEDYDTPRGSQFNSFSEAEGGAVGASLVGDDGFIGVAISRYQSFYGIPGEEAAELRPRIDLEQEKVQARGEWRVGGLGIEAVRFWFGASEYAHNEVVDEGEGDEIGSRFTSESYESRVELQHIPIVTNLGQLRGAIGAQFVNRNTRGQSFERDSLLAPARTESVAAFWFEELDLTAQLTLQGAARIESTTIDGFGRLPPLDAERPLVGLTRDYTPFSASLGGLYRLPEGNVLSLNGQYVERAPDAAELFSAGIHEATGTFEIGNPNLDTEKAASIELGLRKAKGRFRYDTTAFYTRYNGFIFRQLTGLSCEGSIASCEEEGHEDEEHHDEDEHEEEEEGHGHEAFDQVLFGQRDANFFGVEIAAQYDVAPIWNGVWGVEGQYDFVPARFEEGGNVPRIPPHRLGGGLFYRDANWFARAGVLHAFDQNEVGENEIATPGYTLVSAELAYTVALDSESGLGPTMTIGVKGENLANDEVLNHASFKRREDVLLPGANVKVFGSIKLN
ncbi:MAG: TonB-dependent receptor [Alphaproteobacteria bacterium]|nr:TonB-dependent receptor [Alphaproteobacteria bacterium]